MEVDLGNGISPRQLEAGLNNRVADGEAGRAFLEPLIDMMILVDDGGGKWPAINHSPWNGVTLADFVMRLFLFIVGLAVPLAYKRIPNKAEATSKAVSQTLKIFFLGVILQGGYYHGLNDLTYGIDILRIRWCGILQRIAFAYLVVSVCEIWNPRRSGITPPDGSLDIVNMYLWHCVSAVIPAIAKNAMFGSILITAHGRIAAFNSPDYGPPPVGAPAWCQAPFEPEGLLSSVSAVGSCFIGLHFGHILVHFKSHGSRVKHWTFPSLGFIVIGITLHYLGMPLNKPLYSFSYVLVTSGAAGFILVVIYLLVDVYGVRWPAKPLEWMGQNSLIIFVLAACGVIGAAIQGFFWQKPENNLVDFVEEHVFQALISSERVAKLVFVFFEIFFWCLVAGALHAGGIIWKL